MRPPPPPKEPNLKLYRWRHRRYANAQEVVATSLDEAVMLAREHLRGFGARSHGLVVYEPTADAARQA